LQKDKKKSGIAESGIWNDFFLFSLKKVKKARKSNYGSHPLSPLMMSTNQVLASKAPHTSQEKLPRYRDHGGYLVAGGFPVEGFSSALSYQAQDNDLFIVTFPKVSLMKKC